MCELAARAGGQRRPEAAILESTTRVVPQGGNQAIGVGELRRPTVRVVFIEGRRVAERAGERMQLATFRTRRAVVVRVSRDVGDVAARAVFRQYLAEGVIG